ncbi:MAG TPA: lactate utilization protein C [Stellaceae bacterium]|nr:lactate utilization protein C [Stellaceae bacterium]
MSEARDQIFGDIRARLGRGRLDPNAQRDAEERLAAHRRNIVPARAASLDHAGQVALFIAEAEAVQTTIARVAGEADVPGVVADYLTSQNLPAQLVMTPDPKLNAIPWDTRPLLELRRGVAEDGDAAGITGAFAAVAETGTLMLVSGADTPTRNNFLPDTHIVVLRASEVVASYEDGWDRVRAAGAMPRTVNFISGPSRTGDIEQRMVVGAHGPRRLHIVLIDDADG